MPDFHTESLYLALQVGLACIAAQGVLTLLFAKVLPDGFWARKPGFLAHQIIALPMMIIVAIIGTRAWFTDSGLATAEARIYDRAPAAETLCAILLGELVLWDIPLTLLPSIYSHASMGHHIGLAALAAICLSPYMQFYAPFFAGVIEISSVPLQVVDFFHPKNYADLLSAHPLLHTLNAIARAFFILSFVALRTIWFPIVMFAQVFPDLFSLLPHAGTAKGAMLIVAMAFGLSFTVLQLYWSLLLFKQVHKALTASAPRTLY